mmetsp:Transcript_59140/g.158232  ORF Transcript_59140/g.158232 Transcript_59140/m.158232 type:complete len:402 (-) Transcript_59140:2017-3222(-)
MYDGTSGGLRWTTSFKINCSTLRQSSCGGGPPNNSIRMQPQAHMSTFSVMRFSPGSNCSAAMYLGDPAILLPMDKCVCSMADTSPKSHIFKFMQSSSSRFIGFRSRWICTGSCWCMNATPSKSCKTMPITRAKLGRAPQRARPRWSSCSTDPPVSSSVIMHRCGGSRAAPMNSTSRGWRSFRSPRISRRSSASLFCGTLRWFGSVTSFLIATFRPPSIPSNTWPYPPAPSDRPQVRSRSWMNSPRVSVMSSGRTVDSCSTTGHSSPRIDGSSSCWRGSGQSFTGCGQLDCTTCADPPAPSSAPEAAGASPGGSAGCASLRLTSPAARSGPQRGTNTRGWSARPPGGDRQAPGAGPHLLGSKRRITFVRAGAAADTARTGPGRESARRAGTGAGCCALCRAM